MIVSQLIDRLTKQTGNQDQVYWLTRVQLALNELQDASDVVLKEVKIVAPEASSVITLPWFMKNIRGIRPAFGDPHMELNTPHVGYMDSIYEEYSTAWKILGRTPLDRSITQATRLTFEKVEPDETPIIVTVTGRTNFAHEISEEIEVTDTAQSVHAYLEPAEITKNIQDSSDLEIFDATDTLLGTLPNCLLSAPRIKVRVGGWVGSDTINILYQPYLYGNLGSQVPVGYEDAIFWKAIAYHRLPDLATKDPTIYNQVALSALQVAHSGQLRGVVTYQNAGRTVQSSQGSI